MIHAVDDVLDPAFGGRCSRHVNKLVLAVEAAVGVVLDVIGIVELEGVDVLVAEAEHARRNRRRRVCARRGWRPSPR